LRSSVTNPRSTLIASIALLMVTGFPSISTLPVRGFLMPKTTSMSSLRPAPISPLNPRISPRRTLKPTFFRRSSDTSRTSSTTASGSPEKSDAFDSLISLPTISVAISCAVTSPTFFVATKYPSRRTVTLWHTSMISFSRCEM
jgi:hypothetical protein